MGRSERHGQGLEPPERARRPPGWALHVKGHCRKSSQDGPDRDLSLEPRERAAQAVVDPGAERQMPRLVSPEVQPVGLVEARGVAVRRPEETEDEAPLRDRNASDLGVHAAIRPVRWTGPS